MNKTSIEWCTHTLNPIRARWKYRIEVEGKIVGGPKDAPIIEVFLDKATLLKPLRMRKPARIFWNDMSDLFGDWVPDEWIDKHFAVMALTPQHTHLVLTKRAKRMREYWRNPAELRDRWFSALLDPRIFPSDPRRALLGTRAAVAEGIGKGWRKIMLPNVHLGVSCENQKTADERIPELLATPAAVRWVSAEPLLEAVDFTSFLPRRLSLSEIPGSALNDGATEMNSNGLDWIVVGGESGPGARPFDLAWARSLIAQCRAAGVPVFKSSKGGTPSEWPEDLRVREYPA